VNIKNNFFPVRGYSMETEHEEDTDLLDQDIESVDEILMKLTDLEKKYCQIMINQKPKSKSDAMIRAGSKANPKYLSKMAWEIEQRPHVQSYMQHLTSIVVEESGLEIQEIINNARKGIEMAFMNGKPRDAEPHNRMLAEIGGFVRNTSQANNPSANVQINTTALSSESLEKDFLKIQLLAGTLSEEDGGE
jgi:hypothetical protein